MYRNPINQGQVQKMQFDTKTSLATGGICPDPMIISKNAFITGLLEKMKEDRERYIQDAKRISGIQFKA